ncbi:MAG: ribosome maturation factor RimM [Albidovulum sp.]
MATDRICVGAVAGAFGVKGEVRLKSFCAEPAAIADYAPLYNEDGSRSFTVTLTRGLNDGLVARLSGITTKEEADALRGLSLFTDREKLPNLPDDEFYHTDLVGLDVLDTSGAAMGTLRAVYNHGAGDILEIFVPGRKTTLMLPFTKAAVPTVDLTARRIIIDPPEESEAK